MIKLTARYNQKPIWFNPLFIEAVWEYDGTTFIQMNGSGEDGIYEVNESAKDVLSALDGQPKKGVKK